MTGAPATRGPCTLITHIGDQLACRSDRIMTRIRNSIIPTSRLLLFGFAVLFFSACRRQTGPVNGPLNAVGDSVTRVMARPHCHNADLIGLGSAVVECVGSHGDTTLVVTTANGKDVRVVTKIWVLPAANIDLEVRRLINLYSKEFGVGHPVCPIVNAYGRRWQRHGYFITLYPDPRRNQIVEKFQVGIPYDASSCPGIADRSRVGFCELHDIYIQALNALLPNSARPIQMRYYQSFERRQTMEKHQKWFLCLGESTLPHSPLLHVTLWRPV